ncbi:MAG: methylated-DNA--[protein]-cysteine S-methyltransferase [Terriglobales bacterium]
METLCYSTMASPVGPLRLVVSEHGVLRVEFGANLPRVAGNVDLKESPEATRDCREQLEEYFAARRTEFTLPLDLRGTEFQQTCWRALLRIPYGETRSYAELARAIGRPHAARAVGMANHDNPIAIIVPCHRVVGTNGKLTGYGGGLETKRKLLDLERGTLFRLTAAGR